MVYPVVFLFSVSCDPRDLHSFPTRRSSDLGAFAAYAFSRFRFKGRRFGMMALLLIQMFPQFGAIAAIYLLDRKSTRLNSSHPSISYAVFCLKKKINNRFGLHVIVMQRP